jgi:Fur family ferric uptake transcriptional regulator
MTRMTRQRLAVLDALADTSGFISARALHAKLEAQGQAVSLATVYRQLNALAQTDQVDMVAPAGAEATYRACHRFDHHHHVVCRTCGAAVEVAADDVEAWAAAVARQAGFSQVRHTVEITGVCPACQV